MLWWLIVAVTGGLLAAAGPRRPAHRAFGALSLVTTALVFVRSWAHAGDGWAPWAVASAMLLAVLLNAVGLLILLAGSPRHRHRHIVYNGYGLLFTVVAAWWAAVGPHPHGTAVITATAGTLATYGVGSVVLAIYKHRQPVPAPVSPAPPIGHRGARRG
ncbi:hypothetical protein [Rhizomonospora bruguierae]|uniref:hypothetical protein n=1 Tax=Rhizomonospora bruguierae TaxID=1581705 RepID=UPI001BD0517A|nr:hypothetical protein [Micromonospora sp. NBRC 107566]